MSRWQQVRTVAAWEFRRFVKWKQQFIGIGIMVALGLAGGGAGRIAANARARAVTVAVVGNDSLTFPLPELPGVTWQVGTLSSLPEAAQAVRSGTVQGALVVTGPGRAEVLTARRAAWTESVERSFTLARRAAAMAALPITDAQRASLVVPFDVTITTVSGSGATLTRGTRVVALLILGAGLLVLFNGFATLFAGITGEKQQRITEQVIAMVAPQTWMDGKILGLAGAALVSTTVFGLTGTILSRLLPLLTGGTPFQVPPVTSGHGTLALIVVVSVLGTGMWFSFMAAVAASIDDPQASPKASLLLVPTLPLILAFMLSSRADSAVAQGFALFPLTAMGVLPLRLIMTSVPWWEPVVSLALLAATAWVFRRAAGKVFAIGVLMYGKEPSLREMWRWARRA